MNRAQRRMQARGQVIDSRPINVQKIKEDVAKEVYDQVVKCMLECTVQALHDSEGFGKTRIMRVLRRIDYKMDCIADGLETFDGIHEANVEELGINITKEMEV